MSGFQQQQQKYEIGKGTGKHDLYAGEKRRQEKWPMKDFRWHKGFQAAIINASNELREDTIHVREDMMTLIRKIISKEINITQKSINWKFWS